MRARWYTAAGIVAVLAVGACSHSSGGGSAAGHPLSEPGAVHRAPAAAASRAALGPAQAAGGVGDASAAGGSAAQRASVAAKSLPLVDGGYKIQVARMTVAVKGAQNVAAKADEAEAIAQQAGGEVDRDDRTSGPQATAALLLRVPPDALTGALTQLSRLGKEKYRALSTTDVTQRVADVRSRVRSAQDSIARLRVLFRHAKKIGAIIEIESELNTREADLESLQAQRRSLARETSMASITLDLVTAAKAAPPPKPASKHHDNAFVAGLKNGWDGFTAAAAWVAGVIGTLVPFLVLLLALSAGLRYAWPRLRHGRTTTPAATPSE